MREEENFNPIEQPVQPTEPVVEENLQPVQSPEPVVQENVSSAPMPEPQIDPSFGTNVEVPVQPVPEPSKKKSPLPIILVVLIILAGGAFAVWKFVLPNMNKEADKTTTSEVLASVEELKDQSIISKINKGIDYYETETVDRVNENLYKEENFKMTDVKAKAYIALLNTDFIKIQETVDKFNSGEKNWSDAVKSILGETPVNSLVDNDGDSLYDANIYDAKEVAKKYKEIFNEDFVAKDLGDVGFEADGVMLCPTYAYEPNNDVYYELRACGGDSGETHLTYAYKYETVKNGDEVMYNAYVAVGKIAAELVDNQFNYYTYYSYIDTDSKEPNDNEDFKITADNYEKFDKFKYVFNKDKETGNIYVDHVERVK